MQFPLFLSAANASPYIVLHALGHLLVLKCQDDRGGPNDELGQSSGDADADGTVSNAEFLGNSRSTVLLHHLRCCFVGSSKNVNVVDIPSKEDNELSNCQKGGCVNKDEHSFSKVRKFVFDSPDLVPGHPQQQGQL